MILTSKPRAPGTMLQLPDYSLNWRIVECWREGRNLTGRALGCIERHPLKAA